MDIIVARGSTAVSAGFRPSMKRRVSEVRLGLAYQAAERWRARTPQRSGAMEALKRSGPAAADTAARVANFQARETLRPAVRQFQERQIGPTLDYTSFAPDEDARRAGRPVARIVQLGDPGTVPEGFASGFLVAPGMLLTNHHVLPSKAESFGVGANFQYEYTSAGLSQGVTFELDPDTFYYSNERLDLALCAVKPKALSGAQTLDDFGRLPLIEQTGKILVGHPVNIIQYPAGGPKQYATTQNKLLDVLDEGFLHYTTDTLAGSSGSPASNSRWEVIALHHLAIPLVQNGKIIAKDGNVWNPSTMEEDDILWVANEGVRVSAIVGHLRGLQFPDARSNTLLASVVNATEPASERTIVTNRENNDMSNVLINISGNVTMYVNSPAVEPRPIPAPAPMPIIDATVVRPQIEEKKLRFDKRYSARRGYDARFLAGHNIPLPSVGAARRGEMLKDPKNANRDLVLKYHHYSLAMNEERRLQMWSAVNVDYTPAKKTTQPREAFGTDTWIPDPRILGELQIQDDEFYKPATKIDRGHIVRREDNCWGDDELEIEFANSDTFHYTNCTPQHEAFNQDRRRGIWGQFEVHITSELKANDNRCSIFAGPVLDNDHDPSRDFGLGPVQYPLKFWKVIAAVSEEEGLQSWGFLFDQSAPIERFGIEALDFTPFKRFQLSLAAITQLTGVEFPDVLINADVLGGFDERIPVRDLTEVRLKREYTVTADSRAHTPAADRTPATQRKSK
jgi:endonuclease G